MGSFRNAEQDSVRICHYKLKHWQLVIGITGQTSRGSDECVLLALPGGEVLV